MLSMLGAFSMGAMSKGQCADLMPCRAALAWKGRPFKLSFCIHSATLDGVDDSTSSKPYVTVASGDKKKQTEMGDWSGEDGRWAFREVLTMEVCADEEACISLVCNQQYELVVAALSLGTKSVGEVCVPIASVLPQLQMEDRDIEGMVFVTPNIGFDLLKDGVKTGRAYLSFETKQPPQSMKTVQTTDVWCAMSG
eukprot:TRINITY_DN109113_c0_g1_i1.p1 TRINITY_DN109113_c0_g1~~TRINITY_DN109113_c0_g1_i1.p1  ORF type:complete len:195 (-),score=32.34 TRINITY_DN109113_c0_g1_i1:167-751(-)